MEKYRIAMVDDDEFAREIIKDYIEKTAGLELVYEYSDAVKAAQLLSDEHLVQKIDLAILDVEMPEMTGLQLSKAIGNKIPIILSSAHEKYALSSFEFNVVGYLVKPVSYERFFNTIEKVRTSAKVSMDKILANSENSIVIKKMDSLAYVRLSLDEIVFIEADGNYCDIYTTIGERIKTNSQLKEIIVALPEKQFFRIHRSHIVNFNYIRFVDGPIITLNDNKTQLIIGDTYRNDFKEKFMRFSL
jgi:DNA-binding LytR/AlgR family response regulator